MSEVSLARLYVLRATYLLLLVAIPWGTASSIVFSADSIGAGDGRGVTAGLLTTLALMMAAGLRYPLRTVPLLILELAGR